MNEKKKRHFSEGQQNWGLERGTETFSNGRTAVNTSGKWRKGESLWRRTRPYANELAGRGEGDGNERREGM